MGRLNRGGNMEIGDIIYSELDKDYGKIVNIALGEGQYMIEFFGRVKGPFQRFSGLFRKVTPNELVKLKLREQV